MLTNRCWRADPLERITDDPGLPQCPNLMRRSTYESVISDCARPVIVAGVVALEFSRPISD
jgi:hypothetical protein